MVLSSRTVGRTIKPHDCEWCGEEIPVGFSCERHSVVEDGDFRCCYTHPECAAAWGTLGVDDFYEPGGMVRGEDRQR